MRIFFSGNRIKNSGNKTNTGKCRDYPGILMCFAYLLFLTNEFRIYDRELGVDEISALYQQANLT